MKNGNVWLILVIIGVAVGFITFKNYSQNRLVFDDFDADVEVLANQEIKDEQVNVINNQTVDENPKNNISVSKVENVEIKKPSKEDIPSWSYANKKLTILKDTTNYNGTNMPWYKYKNDIEIIEIGNDVKYIGDYAFTGFTNLKKVYFNNNLKKIGKYAFSNTGVEYIILPDSVIEIGEYAFSNNSLMKVLVLSDNLLNVSNSLAKNSKNLEVVILGKNTTKVGEGSFFGTNLIKLVIPNKNFTVNSKFIDTYNKIGLDIWGPTSLKSYAESYSDVYYFSIDKYRPIVYGDKETYTIEFDDLHYGSNGTFIIKTLTNASATFKTAKYMYKDSSGKMILMEGLNYSGTTLKNVKLDVYIDAKVGMNNCTTPVQTVLFIGNSLTNGFGYGMAASDNKSDYVYYVMKYMNNMNSKSTLLRYVTNPFENATTSEARNELVEKMLTSLEAKRSKSKPVKTIFLQYGTNSTTEEERATFTKDSIYLINRLKQTYPDAKIYWIGALVNHKTLALMKDAIAATNITFVDATYIRGTERYLSYMGAKYTRDGKIYRITSSGVASHPGDYGFTRMANSTIDTLKQNNYCANF